MTKSSADNYAIPQEMPKDAEPSKAELPADATPAVESIEAEKTPEQHLRERFDTLVKEAKDLAHHAGEQCGVERILNYGIDVLINKYSAAKVVEAVKKAATAESRNAIGGQLGVIITALEPSAEGRAALHKELRTSGNALIDQDLQDQLAHGSNHAYLNKAHLGRIRQAEYDRQQRLDGLKGKLDLLKPEWRDRVIHLLASGDSGVFISNGLASEFYKRYQGDWKAMQQRLESANGDFFALSNKIDQEHQVLSQEFGSHKELLAESIRTAITQKESAVRESFQPELVAHYEDLEIILASDMKTEIGQKLMETAIAAMESDTAAMKVAIEQDVATQTAELHELLDGTTALEYSRFL
jgi:hypothetical protein